MTTLGTMASDLEWTAAFRRKSEDDQCALLEALLSRASLSVLTHVQDLMPSLFQKDFGSELGMARRCYCVWGRVGSKGRVCVWGGG